jgi:excisionase family DNA binding protein
MEQIENPAHFDRLLTPAEVGEWLQIGTKTIYDYCSRSKFNLPHIRIGGNLRFRRQDISAWLEANVNKST